MGGLSLPGPFPSRLHCADFTLDSCTFRATRNASRQWLLRGLVGINGKQLGTAVVRPYQWISTSMSAEQASSAAIRWGDEPVCVHGHAFILMGLRLLRGDLSFGNLRFSTVAVPFVFGLRVRR